MTTTQTGRDGFILTHHSETGRIEISYDTYWNEDFISLPEKDARVLAELFKSLLEFLDSQKNN